MSNARFVFLGSIVCFLVGTAVPSFSTEAGRVLTVRKNVFLERDGAKRQARPETPLLVKDAVETSVQSRTKLFFRDDSILNLGEQSRVLVEEYLQSATDDRSKSVYRLLEGSLKVVVGNSDLEIHTPTAVAAARGTVFILWLQGVGEAAATGILVLEGEVLLRNIEDTVKKIQRIQTGQMTRIPVGKAPEPPVPAAPDIVAGYDQKTSAVGSVFEKEEDGLPSLPSSSVRLDAMALQGGLGRMTVPPIVQEPLSEGNLRVRIEWSN